MGKWEFWYLWLWSGVWPPDTLGLVSSDPVFLLAKYAPCSVTSCTHTRALSIALYIPYIRTHILMHSFILDKYVYTCFVVYYSLVVLEVKDVQFVLDMWKVWRSNKMSGSEFSKEMHVSKSSEAEKINGLCVCKQIISKKLNFRIGPMFLEIGVEKL